MQITERRIGQSIILDLTGELTYANRTTFKAAVERCKQGGCRHLILNMQGVCVFWIVRLSVRWRCWPRAFRPRKAWSAC
jgi:hypothetical protein